MMVRPNGEVIVGQHDIIPDVAVIRVSRLESEEAQDDQQPQQREDHPVSSPGLGTFRSQGSCHSRSVTQRWVASSPRLLLDVEVNSGSIVGRTSQSVNRWGRVARGLTRSAELYSHESHQQQRAILWGPSL